MRETGERGTTGCENSFRNGHVSKNDDCGLHEKNFFGYKLPFHRVPKRLSYGGEAQVGTLPECIYLFFFYAHIPAKRRGEWQFIQVRFTCQIAKHKVTKRHAGS